MTEHPTYCLKCRRPLEQPATGRPRSYCSTGCRRAGEKEIGRLNGRLESLESRLMEARLGYGLFTPTDQANFEAEIARAEARLRELLEAAPE